ncbi:SIS domain-containing protein [Hafnia alvei]|uniref:Transcriptional regulator, RpiR family n=1 Tax=Hafnia alvei TaxID=569 RepID=A0A1C6Z7E6_HAFAL|nr:SIS domain-containing protein [Hafnia alvei]NLS52282.1 SIS domain-containing protein [Hafnia alvei]SCM55036.1 transcriptional regulator, RpiR family [Hafnia alvei]
MRILQLISLNKEQLTPGERTIADYLLAHPEILKQCSSQEIASQLHISQSSIVKFAKKLNFRGFTDLKMALIEEWGQLNKQINSADQHLHSSITIYDSPTIIAEKLCLEKQEALRDSTDNVNFSQLEKIISLIKFARRIQITGIGGSALAAKDLAYKLMKIGYPVMNELDGHVQITVAQSLAPGDIQIAISYSGSLKEILLAAQVAKNNGAQLVAVTSLQESPLRKIADYTLDTLAGETRWRSSSISARTAQNTITDLLFVCLLQEENERSQRYINRSKEIIDKLK